MGAHWPLTFTWMRTIVPGVAFNHEAFFLAWNQWRPEQ